MHEASNYDTLKKVAHIHECFHCLVYKCFYEQIEFENRKHQSPWSKTVGIDEHSFIRSKFGRKDFTTTFVDYNNKNVREAVYCKTSADLLTDENLQESSLLTL